MDCEIRLEEERPAIPFPSAKPRLSRLRPFFEPPQKPQNPPADKTDPKTQNLLASAFPQKKNSKKLRFLEKKSLRSSWIFVFLGFEKYLAGKIRYRVSLLNITVWI